MCVRSGLVPVTVWWGGKCGVGKSVIESGTSTVNPSMIYVGVALWRGVDRPGEAMISDRMRLSAPEEARQKQIEPRVLLY